MDDRPTNQPSAATQPVSAPSANSTHTPRTVAPAPVDDFLRQYAATYRFRLGKPGSISVTPKGDAVLFLRSGPRSFVQDLFEFDVATGKERVLLTADQILGGGEEKLTAEELARRERMRMASRGIASYSLSKDGSKILVPLSGRLFVIDRAGGQKTELTSTAGYPIDPRLSRDGSLMACVRDGNIFITDVASNRETQITSDAAGSITYGLAEFVAQEEMSRFAGYWLSPDNAALLYQKTDTAGLETFYIADPVDPSKPAQSWPYPRPGKKNAEVTLFLQPLGPGGVAQGSALAVNWDRAKYPYVAGVNWPKEGLPTILVQNREQTEQVLLALDAATGATSALITEKDPAWVNIEQGIPKWLKGGNQFVWMTESGGEWQAQIRDKDGSVRTTITGPGFGLESILNVDDSGWITVAAHQGAQGPGATGALQTSDPAQMHIWKMHAVARVAPRCLTVNQVGVHGGVFADEADVWVHTYSLLEKGDIGGNWEVMKGGQKAGDIPSASETPPFEADVELTTVTGAREYRAAVVRPKGFQQGKKYPVLLSVYGGPHSRVVNASRDSYLLQQWMADAGFVVVSLDGRGTPGRGRDWERAISENLIKVPLDDQIDGLKALGAKYPELDMSRVGVFGWSFGGYFSAHAVMQRPDVFHVGVAGAPVADFADYDTHYTERYLRTPETNPTGYEASSVLTYCKDLSRPLLIIHGTADDNVYFMHSLKMTQSLFRAGRPFDFLPLSGFTHMVPDPVVTERLQAGMRQYFVDHLQ
jgi:dipeptidyl-peptidase-4